MWHCWVGLSTAAIFLLKTDTTHTHMETKWRPPALVCHRNHVTSPAIVKLNRVEQYVPAAPRPLEAWSLVHLLPSLSLLSTHVLGPLLDSTSMPTGNITGSVRGAPTTPGPC